MIAHWKALQQICEGATSHEMLWLKNGWESALPKVLHFELTWNENAHLHPQSQGLQIYSLHHRCQGSSWSQKVRCVRCMELMHRESSYRMAWGGRLLAPEGREPAGSHNIRHMPSSGLRLYLHKNVPNHAHRTYSSPIFTGASGLNQKWNLLENGFAICQLDCFAFLQKNMTQNCCSSISLNLRGTSVIQNGTSI